METLPLILLVDDEEDILDFLERILEKKYHIVKARGGAEALQILGKESIRLIVCDVMMPDMDGFELCKRIKSTPQTSHIPVILLTARNTMQSKIEGLELKADAYIEKPFSKEYLMAQMASLIANREMIFDHLSGSPLMHIKDPGHSKADENFLELVNDTIRKHMEDEHFDLEKLAKMLNMTRITLYRRLKKISRFTPNELINMIRLQKAAEMLAQGEYKIYEVASMVGFHSQSNFTRDFHRQFNVTPSEFMHSRQRKGGKGEEEPREC